MSDTTDQAYKAAQKALVERMSLWRVAVKQRKNTTARKWELTVMGIVLAHMMEGEERLLAEYAAAMLRIVELEDKLASLPALQKACEDFVAKVDAGNARSRESYAQMKAALAPLEQQEVAA